VDEFEEECLNEYVCFFVVNLEGKVSRFEDKFYES